MAKEDEIKVRDELYNKIYDEFISLMNDEIKEVKVELKNIKELDFIFPHYEVVCDNNGNGICTYIDGRHNNYADILREHFGNKKIIQEYNPIDNTYIFRKDVNKCQN